MFNPTKDQVRHFFCTAWQKYEAQHPLVGAEVTVAGIISQHPEYHSLLRNTSDAMEKTWMPENGTMNPFLHLSLHLAVQEQVEIDQPKGVRAIYENLQKKMDAHAAQHILLESLGETIWEAQHTGNTMDSMAYLEIIRKKSKL